MPCKSSSCQMMKTSSVQSKRSNPHRKWLHRETNGYTSLSQERSLPQACPWVFPLCLVFFLLRFSQSLALRLVVLCWRLELFHPWLHSRLSLESNSQSSWRQIMSLLIHRYRSIICSKILGTICSQIASDGILAARRCSDTTRDFIPTREFGNK